MTDADGSAPVPLLRVTRSTATPEELAALVIALASRPAAQAMTGGPSRSEWAARVRTLRVPVHPGPGAWRASALPG